MPRPNDTFYEKNVDYSKRVKQSFIFDTINNINDISFKKNFLIQSKFVNIKDVILIFLKSIYLFIQIHKIKRKYKKIKYLFNVNEFNILNIFFKLIQFRILDNLIKKYKIKYILSNALPTCNTSKMFVYLSNKNRCNLICFITKTICKYNPGYDFLNNNNLYPKYYFINSIKSQRVLQFNGYKEKNIYLFKKKKNYYKSIEDKNKIKLLLIFTRNKRENLKILEIANLIIKKKDKISVYYKFHPQEYNSLIINSLPDEAINISEFNNKEIEKFFVEKNNVNFCLTSFSSYVYKILYLGFIPIWIKGLGDIDYLFDDITKNLGYNLTCNNDISLITKNIIRILNKKKHKLSKQNIYSSDYLKFKDFENYLKKINSLNFL